MELEPPDEAEMRAQDERYPQPGACLTLWRKQNGEMIGYGYASPFRPRAGYRYTVEDSIYLRAMRGAGCGAALAGRR